MNRFTPISAGVSTLVVLGAAAALIGWPTESRAQPPQRCSIQGTWTFAIPGGPAGGHRGTMSFTADGRSEIDMDFTPPLHVESRFTLTGARLQLTDERSTPPPVACPASQPGAYQVTFAAGCGTATLAATQDACPGRRGTLQGAVLTRGAAH